MGSNPWHLRHAGHVCARMRAYICGGLGAGSGGVWWRIVVIRGRRPEWVVRGLGRAFLYLSIYLSIYLSRPQCPAENIHVPHQSWHDRKRLINGDGAYSVRQSAWRTLLPRLVLTQFRCPRGEYVPAQPRRGLLLSADKPYLYRKLRSSPEASRSLL